MKQLPCSLPANTIAAGSHVFLDVRQCVLRVAKALHDPTASATIEIAEYKLRDSDAALAIFDYLQRHGARFSSVKIV